MSANAPTAEAWPAAMPDRLAAKYLGISRSTLWRMVAAEELPEPARIHGRAVRFLRDHLDALLAQKSREANR